MKKHSLVRTIYLYLFALVGLFLIIISSVDFIDMALKATIFTQADEEQRIWEKQPPMPSKRIQNFAESTEKKTTVTLSEDEVSNLENWNTEYTEWKERQEKFDVVVARRQRDASRNISMLLVGIPLYMYHWAVIKRETKDKDKEKKQA
jgi:hypothetical protein